MALSDTYITVAEADTYHSEHNPNSDWGAASTPDKEAAIREATQYLEQEFTWIGDIKDSTQALAWPRDVTKDKRGRQIQAPYPQQVMDACAELALEALAGPLKDERGSKNDEISRVKAGPVEVEYNPYSGGKRSFPHALSLLKWLIESSSSINVNVQRVQ